MKKVTVVLDLEPCVARLFASIFAGAEILLVGSGAPKDLADLLHRTTDTFMLIADSFKEDSADA